MNAKRGREEETLGVAKEEEKIFFFQIHVYAQDWVIAWAE